MTAVVEVSEEQKLVRSLKQGKDTFSSQMTAAEWLKQCQEIAEEAGKVWNTDKSAANIISEMRD